MVNILTIAIVHAVLFLAALRLMMRADLDQDAEVSGDGNGDNDGPDGETPETDKKLSPSQRRRARLRASRQ
ncbi:MAG: hypothetical protein AAGL10_06895 [Pseudomonadota bacterium]